jgi:hypothetical protein
VNSVSPERARKRSPRAAASSPKSRRAGIAVEGGRLVHFLDVVIFAFRPEDGNEGASLPAGQFRGEVNGGEGLEEGEEGAAEESGLLSGDDRLRPGPEEGDVGERLGGGPRFAMVLFQPPVQKRADRPRGGQGCDVVREPEVLLPEAVEAALEEPPEG